MFDRDKDRIEKHEHNDDPVERLTLDNTTNFKPDNAKFDDFQFLLGNIIIDD